MKKIFFCIIVLTFASAINAQAVISIAEIQGDEFLSPHVGKKVKTQGIVTAVRRSGFYIQNADDKVDANPKTSEGVYVYTKEEPPSKVKVGNLVQVKGTVKEFRHRRENYGLFLTEIIMPDVDVLSTDNPLPKPIKITKELLSPKGKVDQLEPFEGMRVEVDELMVVAPTGGYYDREEHIIKSDGVFHAVLSGTPRAFRERGLDSLKVLFDKLPLTLSIFDMNPEVVRIDSNGINGATPIDVTTGTKIKNVLGIMDYGYSRYTIILDPSVTPEVEGSMQAIITSPAAEGEVTVGSFNLENFFDDEKNSKLDRKETMVKSEVFERRLKKASLAIRNVLSMPDVLGIVEVENLKVLQKLAKRINEDASSANQENPSYEAYLEESNDPRGIDVGFLIKTSKVKVIKSEQIMGDQKLKHKTANPGEKLFSRPPMLIEVEISDEKTGGKLAFTAIVNHFKSFIGTDDPKNDRVRHKRRLQAEFLAKFVSERQTANPDEKMVVMGDFNAFQFNDGNNDLIGTLLGKPHLKITTPAENIVQTGLVNLVDLISAETRYSYIYGGNAQVLDHILVNKKLLTHAKKFGYARFNVDFPKVLANDETRPERISDHDVPVLFLSLDDGRKKEADSTKTKTP